MGEAVPAMSPAAVLLLVALAGVLLDLILRWYLRGGVVEAPRLQVVLSAGGTAGPGFVEGELVLRGTGRRFVLRSVTTELATVERLGLGDPVGFHRAVARTDGEVVWLPAGWPILRPGRPLALRVPIQHPDAGPGRLRIAAEALRGDGRTELRVAMPVGLTRARDVERSNLRSELLARAAELGVVPAALPGWSRVGSPDPGERARA